MSDSDDEKIYKKVLNFFIDLIRRKKRIKIKPGYIFFTIRKKSLNNK